MTQKTYDRVSQRAGAFVDFSRGLDLLKNNAIPFALRMAVLKINQHEIGLYRDWCKTNSQSQYLFICTLSLQSRRDNPVRNATIRKQRIEPLLASQLLIGTANQSELVKFCREHAGPMGSRLFNCGWGDEPAVDAYGFLQGCLMLRHPEFVFNLHTGRIKTALEGFFPRMKSRATNNPEYLKKCGRCRFFGFCDQCPAMSYMENGTLDTPVEYICQLTRAQVNMFDIKATDDDYHHPLNIGYLI
jgi:radical SAM protein with 4Fe4S-binding SPASM domain